MRRITNLVPQIPLRGRLERVVYERRIANLVLLVPLRGWLERVVHERRITNPARAFSVLRGFAIPVFAQQQDLLLELIGAPDCKSCPAGPAAGPAGAGGT